MCCAQEDNRQLKMKSIVYLVPIWILATLWLYFLSQVAPIIEDDNERELHFPRDLEDLKNLAVLLKLYNQRNVYYTTLLFSSAYIYKQTFVIPGSVFLNLLGGALYGLLAFPLVVFLTGIGATLCYTWSYYFGRDLIEVHFPHKVGHLQEKIKENEHQLLYYILFLRLFPVSPNWLINVASPIIGVPISTFFISAVVGLAPYNFLTVQAGQILGSLTSVEDLFTFPNMLKMSMMACVALIPSFFMKKRLHMKQH